jgi:hypothetical protein
MANNFLLKYSATSGVVPTSAELPLRQIALNTADGKLFIKKNDGSILTFESAAAFARAVHSHVISDVTGLQDALDTLTSAAAAAQSGADASLKISSNLSDLASASTARTNLGVDSSAEVDTKISTSKSASDAYTDAAIAALINGSPATLDTLKEIADALAAGEDVATALTNSIASVSSRVDTLEGQNLDSRLSTAESDIDTLQSDVVTAQNAANAAQSTADSAVTAAAAAQSAADAAQSSADSAASAAATAQSGADASVKKAANLSDLADAAASRGNLGVDSSAEVDTKVSNAVSAAETALQSDIDGVDARVTTLEGQNLDSRLTSAEGTIAGLGTMATQDAGNVNITGGTFGAGTAPTDSGLILTENSTLDGGTFSGFNGGGGGGGATSYAASFTGSNSVSLTGSFGLGTGDFTVEGFFNQTGYTGGEVALFCDQVGGLVAYFNGGTLYVGQTGFSGIASVGVPADSNWHHLAIVRESGTLSVYIDGTQATSTSDSTDFTVNGNAVVGALYNLANGFVGKVGSVRVSSVARYSGSSYTVPTGTFTSDGSTLQLLLQDSSVDGSLTANGSVSMVQGPF